MTQNQNPQEWAVQAAALKQSGMTWEALSEKYGKSVPTLHKYVRPLMQSAEQREEPESAPTEPKPMPLDLLKVLYKRPANPTANPEPLSPSELPANVDTEYPWPTFLFKAARQAWVNGMRAPVVISGALLAIIFNFTVAALPLFGVTGLGLVALPALFVWWGVSTKLMKSQLTEPAMVIRKDSYGTRYLHLQSWWRWEGINFNDGMKHEYMKRRMVYLDASTDVVRAFNAYASPLPRTDLRPQDVGFQVTSESLARLDPLMKNIKDDWQDVETSNDVFLKWGLLGGILVGCVAAIYWAVLTIQDTIKGV